MTQRLSEESVRRMFVPSVTCSMHATLDAPVSTPTKSVGENISQTKGLLKNVAGASPTTKSPENLESLSAMTAVVRAKAPIAPIRSPSRLKENDRNLKENDLKIKIRRRRTRNLRPPSPRTGQEGLFWPMSPKVLFPTLTAFQPSFSIQTNAEVHLAQKRKTTSSTSEDPSAGSEAKVKVVKFTKYYFSYPTPSEPAEIKKRVSGDASGRSHKEYDKKIQHFLEKDMKTAEFLEKESWNAENFDMTRGTWAWGCGYCGEVIDPCICIRKLEFE